MTNAGNEPRHPIQVVARRTGLTPDVIRIWERRYHAVDPERASNRRRLYTDEDVERLTLLHRAIRSGRRIGDVANLPIAELAELVAADEQAAADAPVARADAASEGDAAAYLEASLAAVARLDAVALERTLTRARLDLSTPLLIDTVLMPLLQEVGERWAEGGLRIYHEHLATSLVKSLLENLRPAHGQLGSGPDLLVTTPAGQLHELGALMAGVIAATEGWRVTYLGPNLPAEEIAAAAGQRRAAAVALSVVYPPDDPHLGDELRRLRQLLPSDVPIVVGGAAAPAYHAPLARIGAHEIQDFRRLRADLAEIRGRRRATPADGDPA